VNYEILVFEDISALNTPHKLLRSLDLHLSKLEGNQPSPAAPKIESLLPIGKMLPINQKVTESWMALCKQLRTIMVPLLVLFLKAALPQAS